MTPVRTYWCRTCGVDGRNFGDQLGPRLLERFGIPYEWATGAEAELVTVGSVVSKLPDGWRGIVLGTGTIRSGIRVNLSNARVLAVRGDLTRRACRIRRGVTLADPGILAPDFLAHRPEPTGRPVVVPHYVDADLAPRHRGDRVLDVCGDPIALLEGIAAAAVVYTSSLHALIAADALGVPQILEPHPAVAGGLHKFSDYASAFRGVIRPGRPHLTHAAAMATRQAELRSLYESLSTVTRVI